jgi:hypothetical protein
MYTQGPALCLIRQKGSKPSLFWVVRVSSPVMSCEVTVVSCGVTVVSGKAPVVSC